MLLPSTLDSSLCQLIILSPHLLPSTLAPVCLRPGAICQRVNVPVPATLFSLHHQHTSKSSPPPALFPKVEPSCHTFSGKGCSWSQYPLISPPHHQYRPSPQPPSAALVSVCRAMSAYAGHVSGCSWPSTLLSHLYTTIPSPQQSFHAELAKPTASISRTRASGRRP